jgi:hypothetical protein
MKDLKINDRVMISNVKSTLKWPFYKDGTRRIGTITDRISQSFDFIVEWDRSGFVDHYDRDELIKVAPSIYPIY